MPDKNEQTNTNEEIDNSTVGRLSRTLRKPYKVMWISQKHLKILESSFFTKYLTKDLYFIREVGTTHYKIGISSNVEKRLGALQSANSNKLEIVCVIKYGELFERRLHDLFEDRNIHGEWFDLRVEDFFQVFSYMYEIFLESLDINEIRNKYHNIKEYVEKLEMILGYYKKIMN